MKKLLFFAVTFLSLSTFVACSSDDDEDKMEITSSTNVELTSQKTSQIVCSDAKATYQSEDEYVASVSDKGLITAGRIGETYIDVNGKKSVKVTVTPVYTQYVEPLFMFGSTKNELIAKAGSDYKSTDGKSIYYMPTTGRVKIYLYIIEDDKVTSAAMAVSTTYLESLTSFLLERYVPATFTDDDYTAIFMNALTVEKTTMVVAETVYSSSLMLVSYAPYSGTKTKAGSVIDHSECLKMKAILNQTGIR